MDLILNIVSECSDSYRGEAKEYSECILELVGLFVEYEDTSYFYNLLHNEVFSGLLNLTHHSTQSGLSTFQKILSKIRFFQFTPSISESTRKNSSSLFKKIVGSSLYGLYPKIFEGKKFLDQAMFCLFLAQVFAYCNELGEFKLEWIEEFGVVPEYDREGKRREFRGKPILEVLVDVLDQKVNTRLVLSALELLYHVLGFGEKNSDEDEENLLAIEFQEMGGTDILLELQQHAHQRVYEDAVKVVKTFY